MFFPVYSVESPERELVYEPVDERETYFTGEIDKHLILVFFMLPTIEGRLRCRNIPTGKNEKMTEGYSPLVSRSFHIAWIGNARDPILRYTCLAIICLPSGSLVKTYIKEEVRRKMNFTYVLGFVVLRDLVKVFPVSSSSFARKKTGRNRARSHSGAWRGQKTKWDLKLTLSSPTKLIRYLFI